MIACPAVPIDGDGDGGLAAGLAAIDCQLGAAVQAGYAHVFGAEGGFGTALRALLVIWVAVLALGLIGGHLRLSLRALGPRLFGFGLVLTFATAWPAYQTVVYGLLVGGPDQIASGVLGVPHGATQAFAGRLDRLFASLVELGRQYDAQAGGEAAANVKLASRLVWSSAVLLLCATVGLLVVARAVLAVLLALGPVFIVLALFRGTRGLCEGWLRMALAFALVPMLVTLSGAGLLRVLEPVIAAIALDPLAAAEQRRPLLMLVLGCVIYLGLLAAMAWTAAGIVRGWRMAYRRDAGDPGAGALAAASRGQGGQGGHAPGAPAPPASAQAAQARAIAVVAALHARQARPGPSAAPVVAPGAAAAAPAGARRGTGLGQRFRPAAPSAPLGSRFH